MLCMTEKHGIRTILCDALQLGYVNSLLLRTIKLDKSYVQIYNRENKKSREKRTHKRRGVKNKSWNERMRSKGFKVGLHDGSGI